MSEIEQRLQRHVRAMGAVNRQLQAQMEGSRTWTPAAGQGESDLLTSSGATSGAFITGGRRAGTANAWLEQLAVSTEGQKPFLVHLASGRTYLVEGGYRRAVPSGLLVAALERMLGPTHNVSNDEADRWTDGVPVQVLEGPQGPPFVVVGGQRLPIRGLPLPYPVGADLSWGRDFWRTDAALGYRFTAHTQMKLQYSLQHESASDQTWGHILAAQFTVRF